MKKTMMITKYLFIAPLMLGLTGCLNQAKQVDAEKKGFKINESKALELMSSGHKAQASSLTVFWIPNSGIDPNAKDQDITKLTKAQLADKRSVVATIIKNSSALETKGPEAQEAGAFLQSPKTQCSSLLKAGIGLKMCAEGKDKIEATKAYIDAKQEEIDSGNALLDESLVPLQQKIDYITNEIETKEDTLFQLTSNTEDENIAVIETLNIEIPKLSAQLAQLNSIYETQLKPKIEALTAGQKAIDAGREELLEKVSQCEALPGLWAQLEPFHKNMPECREKYGKVLQAKALLNGIKSAIGIKNWFDTEDKEGTNNSVEFKKDSIEIALVFGEPNLDEEKSEDGEIKDFKQNYSTSGGDISKVSYDPKTRNLKFNIEEKDREGNPTGNILEVSLEKTATPIANKYTGCIKRYVNGIMRAEGKMVIEFKK